MTLLVAPEGSGKTSALRRFIATPDARPLWFDARPTDTNLTRFVRGLATAVQPALPEVPQSLAIAHERAMQAARPADSLAAWLAEHLRETSHTIVVDNYHRCEQDPAISAFLAGVIDRTRGHTRWIVATRLASHLPFAKWFARGDAAGPIDEAAFALTPDEAAELAAQVAPELDVPVVHRLHEKCSGSVARFRFALETLRADPRRAQRFIDADSCAVERLVEDMLVRLDAPARRFVVATAVFPDLAEALLAAGDVEDPAASLAALAASAPHIFDSPAGVSRYTPFFADMLRAWLHARGGEAIASAYGRAARALERSERFVEALAYQVTGREFRALSLLLDARGLGLVDAGYGDVIAESIDALDPVSRAGSPVILAIRATFESRLGRFETAESWFKLALERTTASGIQNSIAYQYGTHLLRFKKPEAIALLEDLVARTGADDELHCYGRSALGPAYVFARRNDAAQAAADAALHLSNAAPNWHLRARVFHQAAFVALCRDEGERAKLLAAISLKIAREHGYFDIAAGALTVLYNVASDIEDDPEQSLELLDEVARCAAKSGSSINHFLALVAKLEIHVERGDEAAIEELDFTLRTTDARSSGSAAYEALVASQAIRAGWKGDYAQAYRLLVSSTEQQWSADRKALRWAEVGVYAAAAGLGGEAATAIANAAELLMVCEPAHRIVRARLFLALAMILSGRSESALEVLAFVDTDPHAASPRLAALRRAVAALWDRYRGVRNGAVLLDVFDALDKQHLGGIGRLLLNFPLTDNASLRLSDLSLPERRVLAKIARRDSFVSERQIARILAKLGCADVQAALRAVERHPLAVHAGGEGSEAVLAGAARP